MDASLVALTTPPEGGIEAHCTVCGGAIHRAMDRDDAAALVASITAHACYSAGTLTPKKRTFMGDDGVLVVQIDTHPGAGRFRANVNDVLVWDGASEEDGLPGSHFDEDSDCTDADRPVHPAPGSVYSLEDLTLDAVRKAPDPRDVALDAIAHTVCVHLDTKSPQRRYGADAGRAVGDICNILLTTGRRV